MDEMNQGATEQSAGDQAAADAIQAQPGNDAGGASTAEQSLAVTSAADAPISGSAEAVEGQTSGDEAVPDHKSILCTLLDDLEGIVHMGKSEIIAVIDRAKALL
jgi:hypothetical protein